MQRSLLSCRMQDAREAGQRGDHERQDYNWATSRALKGLSLCHSPELALLAGVCSLSARLEHGERWVTSGALVLPNST